MVDAGFGRAVGNLFLGGPANVTWERALEGLTAEDAARVPGGLPHSVAQIVAHVQFWQSHLLSVIGGGAPAIPEHAAEAWPEPGDWDILRAALLHDAARLRLWARDETFVSSVDRQGRPHGALLTNFAGHSVYHLGQAVAARQALGLWPPPGGGDTW